LPSSAKQPFYSIISGFALTIVVVAAVLPRIYINFCPQLASGMPIMAISSSSKTYKHPASSAVPPPPPPASSPLISRAAKTRSFRCQHLREPGAAAILQFNKEGRRRCPASPHELLMKIGDSSPAFLLSFSSPILRRGFHPGRPIQPTFACPWHGFLLQKKLLLLCIRISRE
jgi:hypothetical protein